MLMIISRKSVVLAHGPISSLLSMPPPTRQYNLPKVMPPRTTLTPDTLLARYPREIRARAERLRALLRETSPESSESANAVWRSISYAHPDSGYFCGLFPFPDRLDVAFEWGVLLPDPQGLLEGDGKQVRYVHLFSAKDIHPRALRDLIHAALALPPGRAPKLAMLKMVPPAGK